MYGLSLLRGMWARGVISSLVCVVSLFLSFWLGGFLFGVEGGVLGGVLADQDLDSSFFKPLPR